MKTNRTIKHILLAFTMVLGMAACKKDKKDPEPAPPVEVTAITLTDLKALSTGASVKVPDAKKITGIVISDVSNKNIDSKTVVLQDAASQTGIIITFDAVQTFAAGDQLEVNISNQTLAQVNGEVVLQNIPAANAKKTGTGTIAAKATTAAEIATNKSAWDGTLVTVAATELTGGDGKYTGELTITDVSGTITSNVVAGATFENTTYPVSVSAVTGIVRVTGTGARIDIRKTADVVTGAITRTVTEMFENPTNRIDPTPGHIQQGGFTTNVAAWGTQTICFAFLTPGSTYDASYTTPGRSYIYMMNSDKDGSTGLPVALTAKGGQYALACNNTDLKGLKTVSVTFAASMGTDFSFRRWASQVTFADKAFKAHFDESTDYVQIGIGITDGLQNSLSVKTILGKSVQYKKAGVFYTYTWTVPTKAELIAGGLSDAEADTYLENPSFAIYNLSKIAGATPFKNYAPILFDKVVLGFTN